MHDPRVGRFFAVDPLEKSYPFYSPYQFSGNRVIDVAELEGLEPGIGVDFWIDLIITTYTAKLKVTGDKALKDWYQGSTNSNESINENPIYSQQTKDNLHTLQKIDGAVRFTSVIMDPSIQTIKTLSPVDDAMTLTTGKTHDVAEVRDATGWEKFFAGVEILAFFFDASVVSKPTQKIVTEVAEESAEKVSKEITEKSVREFSHTISESYDDFMMSSLDDISGELTSIDIIAQLKKVDNILEIEVSVIPRTVMYGEETLKEAHKRLKGQYGRAIIQALDELSQEAMKRTGTKEARVFGGRETGVRQGKTQSATTKLRE